MNVDVLLLYMYNNKIINVIISISENVLRLMMAPGSKLITAQNLPSCKDI